MHVDLRDPRWGPGWWACGRKRRYDGPLSAASAAATLNRTRAYRNRLEPYACAWCDGWHIGHAVRPRSASADRAARGDTNVVRRATDGVS